jgi:hypothetical protein
MAKESLVAEPTEGHAQDLHPLLVARAWPKQELGADFESWQGEKHLEDLMKGEGAVKAVFFKTTREALPQAYQGTGSIMCYYTARDVPGLLAWIHSAALRDGIEDGGRWFGGFNELDDDIVTRDVYRVVACHNAGLSADVEGAPLFVERFAVDDERLAGFDDWVGTVHLPAIAADSSVLRARTLATIPDDVPWPSRANRMVAVEVNATPDLRTALTSPQLLDALADSMRWDRELDYIRREVYAYSTHKCSLHGGTY